MRFAVTALIGTLALASLTTASAQEQARPVFRTAVDRVTVATMVRDRHGRPITDLKREDFELFDAGHLRPISEFRSEMTPLTIALLMDTSGSMGLLDRRQAARSVAADIMSWLGPEDRVGLFAFDKHLRELAPFGAKPSDVLDGINALHPYGMTSLFDAVAETGKMLAEEGSSHRAIIALTDGIDNASQITATRASAIAASVDVPVYILVVSAPSDRAGRTEPDDAGLDPDQQAKLSDLARWTGGQTFVASSPERSRVATREIAIELRHQYVIVFAPDPRPGWHGIEIRTRVKDLVVRARSGYVVESRPE
jgi:VWFA-related protein